MALSGASQPQVWLVTGCSQGFGRIFVEEISSRGHKVIATARNRNAIADLEQLRNVKTMQLDVTSSQDVLGAKVEAALGLYGTIDVLINNAGYVLSGVWEEVSDQAVAQQFETNFWGAMRTTKAVLPHLREKGSGTIIFMSSIAAWLGAAAGGPYSVSKFALEGAVECLNKEISPIGLRTHLVVLGQFRTNILAATNKMFDRSKEYKQYDEVIEAVSRRHSGTNNKQPGNPVLAVKCIADAILREGFYENMKEAPLRIVLGSDAVAILRSECEAMIRELDQFQAIAAATDYPDAEVEAYK